MTVHQEAKNLSQRTADKLSALIMEAGEFRPGQKIPNENELSVRFGVSRATLREAVRILVAAGMLEVRRGTGTFVTAELPERSGLGLPDLNAIKMQLRDLYEVRLIFEPKAAALACRRATDGELSGIMRSAQEIKRLILAGEDTADEDLSFHSAILRAAHNDYILEMIPVIGRALSDRRYLAAEADLSEWVLTDHATITDFLLQRDEQGAESAVRIHLLRPVSILKL